MLIKVVIMLSAASINQNGRHLLETGENGAIQTFHRPRPQIYDL